MSRRVPLAVTVTGDDVTGIDDEIALGLYFAISEAAQNATKHAGDDAAMTIDFHLLDGSADLLEVTVADDGAGFDASSTPHRRGLLNIEDRISAVGGSVAFASAPGAGTRCTMTVPLLKPEYARLGSAASRRANEREEP